MKGTALTRLTGVRHPVVQTGMGWVAGPRLVSASANAGALGILASATMPPDRLREAVREVKCRTDAPFGVNLRADAADAGDRVRILIEEGVRVASFALAPSRELIGELKEAGVVVMPTVGARRHAEKVAAWGADAVLVQGAEGGGHTGEVATTVLLPQVVDAVRIPVVAAGGFRRLSGLTWPRLVRDGLALRHGKDLTWSQVLLAANTPMLLKSAMVDGRTDLGVMASGQVAGVIDDLPSCAELVERIVKEAEETLARLTDVR